MGTTGELVNKAVTPRERALAWGLALFAFPLVAVALAGSYYFDRPFWSDEVLSWLIASDPNFSHGMAALAGGVDTNAPLLHLLFRAVGSVFGATPIVYRLTCLAGMSFAFVGLYFTLRRSVRGMPALFGCLCFASLPIVIAHATEARFYSFELAAIVWLNLWLARRRDAPSFTSAIAIALTSIALCGVHYFGVLALGCIVFADLFRSPSSAITERFKRWIGRTYPAIAGLAMTACLLPLIVAQRSAMRDAGGTWVPNEFATNLKTTLVMLLPLPAILAITAAAIVSAKAAGRLRLVIALRDHRVVLLAAATYVVAMLIFDRFVQPVFVPRYFIVVLPVLASLAAAAASLWRPSMVRLAIGGVAIAFGFELWQIRERAEAPSGRSAAGLLASVREVNAGIPIISDWLGHALPIWTDRPDLRGQVSYVADPRLHEAGFDQAIRYERQMAVCVQRFYGAPASASLRSIGRLDHFVFLTEFPETIQDRFPGYDRKALGTVTFELTRHGPSGEQSAGRAAAAD